MMSVRITLNQQAIAKLGDALRRSADKTMETLKTEVINAQVMPFNVGTMQNTNTFVDTWQNGDEIHSSLITGNATSSPQARRLYHNPQYNFQTVNNKNAKGEWLEDWINGDQKHFVRDTYADILKKEVNL